MGKKICVTGGAGYIGSHTCVELLESGYDLVVYDNLCNSNQESLRRVESITGKNLTFVKGDIRDGDLLKKSLEGCEAVIHFAGLKAVGESNENPIAYYENNVQGILSLIKAMTDSGIKTLVFSSSATVYGDPKQLPLTEEHPLSPTNPYGHTKGMCEQILKDLYQSDSEWRIALLRYFNPVGAHKSGLIGEDPVGIPNNLTPYVAQVAIGRREKLTVHGNDYDTPDGTGVRDYIHVVDLAKGHIKALDALKTAQCEAINLGTGNGYSVLEVVSAYERAAGKKIPFTIEGRRSGDIATCYADPGKAKRLLGWEASFGINEMCEDSWRWQSQNPNGYV